MRVESNLPAVQFEAAVLQSIRRHARSHMEAEICGVLIGAADANQLSVTACIAGEHATQGGSHVTFTQETWEHIYRIKDRDFPERAIVGWYHSHPGFGIFLSDYDLFIHENFFAAPHQVAWVFDPHSDEEGCFGWQNGSVRQLHTYAVRQQLVDESLIGRTEQSADGQNQTDLGSKAPWRHRLVAWVRSWIRRSPAIRPDEKPATDHAVKEGGYRPPAGRPESVSPAADENSCKTTVATNDSNKEQKS